MSTILDQAAVPAGAQAWQPDAYRAEALRIATSRIEESTRHGGANGLGAEAASVHLQLCTVDVVSSVRVPVTYSTLAGRCSEGADVRVVDGEDEADAAQAEEVDRILRDARTAAALRQVAQVAAYGEVQEGRPLGIAGRDVRWWHQCRTCGGDGTMRCRGCGGSGSTTCTSCGGSGSHTEWTTDHQGNSQSRTVSCTGCLGGSVRCTGCGGSGTEQCGDCAATGWQTRSSVARAVVREQRSIEANWRHPRFGSIFGGTIELSQLEADGLARIEAREEPVLRGTTLLRRFRFSIPAAAVAMRVAAIREEVFVVGYKPRLQLAESFLDQLLKDDIDAVVVASERLHWSAPWAIVRARPAWRDFRENEVLEALVQSARSLSARPSSPFARISWAWRGAPEKLDRERLHAMISGSVSIATIARSLAAADRYAAFARGIARMTGVVAMLGAVALGQAGAADGIGAFSWAAGSLAVAFALGELAGWWLVRPLGVLGRAR